MMVELQEFGQYQLSQREDGATVELSRSDSEVVCLAFDAQRHYFVELHVLDAFEERDAENAPALEREFEAAAARVAQIRHPQVIRVLDWGMDEGTPYYVTALIDGEPLRRYAERAGQVPPMVILKVGHQLVRALEAVATVPGALAEIDVWNSRVSIEPGIPGLRVTVCDLGLDRILAGGDPQESPEEEEARCCAGIGAVMDRLGGARPAGALGALTARIAAGQIADLDALTRRLEACEEAILAQEPVLGAPVVPAPAMGAVLRLPSSFGAVLGDGEWLPVEELPGGDPYSVRARPADGGSPCRIQPLPSRNLCQVGLGKKVQQAMSEIEPERHPNLLPVELYWGNPGGDLFAEEIGDAMPVAAVALARGGLDAEEIHWVLEGVSAGIEQARGEDLAVWGLSPGTILVAGAGREAEARERWRALPHREGARVLLRAHPTTLSLVQPAHFFAGGGVPESAASAPENYKAFLDLASALAGLEPNPVVRSAIGRFVMAERNRFRDSGSHATATAARDLRRGFLGRMHAMLTEAGLEDSTTVAGQADRAGGFGTGSGGYDGEPNPVPDTRDDDPVAFIDDEADEDFELSDPAEGLAEVLFGDEDAAALQEVAAWNPVARSVIRGDAMDEAEEDHGFIEDTARSPSFFWAVVAVVTASLIAAAVIAHLSGKAFWLEQGI